MSTTKLTIEEFGAALLRTQDLDPLYVMLDKAYWGFGIDQRQDDPERLMGWEELCQFCVAYWCNYHAGVAAHLATLPEDGFWPTLMDVAQNTTRRWPRGTERRHFRGKAAESLVHDLASKYPTAEDFVLYVAGAKPRTFKDISARVQEHSGFGPWIAFKIADMLERVLEYAVDFSNCELSLYRAPAEGALLAAQKWGYEAAASDRIKYSINRLLETFGDEYAVPRGGTRLREFVNIQEVETILCKWKSHMNGHYPVGKDSHEIREGLKGWGPLAEKLIPLVPEGK